MQSRLGRIQDLEVLAHDLDQWIGQDGARASLMRNAAAAVEKQRHNAILHVVPSAMTRLVGNSLSLNRSRRSGTGH
jgi:hypothetical protein